MGKNTSRSAASNHLDLGLNTDAAQPFEDERLAFIDKEEKVKYYTSPGPMRYEGGSEDKREYQFQDDDSSSSSSDFERDNTLTQGQRTIGARTLRRAKQFPLEVGCEHVLAKEQIKISD